MDSAARAKKTLEIVEVLSDALNTGLTRQELSILLALVENGCNPEALAKIVMELRQRAKEMKTSSQQAPLVRAVGQEYVHQQLSAKPPVEAIRAIKQHASLSDPRCKPLLGLLDQLGAPRADTHRAVLEAAKRKLSELMKKLDPDSLQLLLTFSFPYVGVPELRDIPLAVLGQLQPVPPDFLLQLAKDKELFADLPSSVQIQVFEMDKKLLQIHAMPYIAAYTWEKGTLMRALDMDEFLPPRTGGVPEEELRLRSRRLPRRQQRKMSPALKKLVAMVGGSFKIYKGIVDLCAAKFRDSEGLYVGLKELAYCSLRSQLLMALHDSGANELCSKEACHKLAWILDACCKDQSLDERRLKELSSCFSAYQGVSHHKGHKRARDWEGEAGSKAKSDSDEPYRVLAEAGMVLREPCTLHLIIHQVLRRLEALVESEAPASSDSDLVFMTCLMQLAVGARKMLRDRRYHFPEVSSDLLKTFYPILSSFILEVQLREPNETDDEGSEEIDGSLVNLLQKDEIVRKVTQIFCLERLASGDTITARTLLANIVAALHKLSDRGIVEWAAFAATLAQRLARMLAAGLISPAHQIWNLAVDSILIKAVDADIQVHEEVLRLLLAASQQLSVPQLAQYLQSTINNSKRSRRRFKRRHVETTPIGTYAGYGSEGTSGYNSSGFTSSFVPDGALSDGVVGPASKKVSDGIKSVYQDFYKQNPDLTEETAPVLHQYLNDAV